MRTVSFSDPKVRSVLSQNFLSTFTNTQGDPSAGASFSHSPADPPGPCGPGAGRQNVQCIFLTRGGEIFHVAGGFLDGPSLLNEIKFASDLFAKLKESQDPRQLVADTHRRFLAQNGFSPEQIRSGQVGLFDENMPNFSPKDLGIDIPAGQANQFLDQMHRYRVLADHRYLIQNPLVQKSEFDEAPEKLVGNQKSFFGSNAAMNSFNPMLNRIPPFGRNQQSNRGSQNRGSLNRGSQNRGSKNQKSVDRDSDRDVQRSFQFDFDRGRSSRIRR